ncbi:hypothetical protein [Streptomyces sp. NPDC054854]
MVPVPVPVPVPASTYGVAIRQEQIIDIFAVLTGCDRALAIADKEPLPQVEAWFKPGLRPAGPASATPPSWKGDQCPQSPTVADHPGGAPQARQG